VLSTGSSAHFRVDLVSTFSCGLGVTHSDDVRPFSGTYILGQFIAIYCMTCSCCIRRNILGKTLIASSTAPDNCLKERINDSEELLLDLAVLLGLEF